MTHKDSFVARLMRAAITGDTVEIYGDGTQRRDFVHVDDVVQGLLLAWRRRCTSSLIIGSGRSITVLDLLDQARRVTGRPLPAVHVAPKPGEMPAVVVDIGRARSLGYRPTVALEDGLLTAWADFAGAEAARMPVAQAPRP
jgi:UDP-glucose 4-epimerase